MRCASCTARSTALDTETVRADKAAVVSGKRADPAWTIASTSETSLLQISFNHNKRPVNLPGRHLDRAYEVENMLHRLVYALFEAGLAHINLDICHQTSDFSPSRGPKSLHSPSSFARLEIACRANPTAAAKLSRS